MDATPINPLPDGWKLDPDFGDLEYRARRPVPGAPLGLTVSVHVAVALAARSEDTHKEERKAARNASTRR
jgi:hypothetical protein